MNLQLDKLNRLANNVLEQQLFKPIRSLLDEIITCKKSGSKFIYDLSFDEKFMSAMADKLYDTNVKMKEEIKKKNYEVAAELREELTAMLLQFRKEQLLSINGTEDSFVKNNENNIVFFPFLWRNAYMAGSLNPLLLYQEYLSEVFVNDKFVIPAILKNSNP